MSRARRSLAAVLTAGAALALIWAVVLVLGGSINVTVAGIHVSSNSVWRPIAVALVLTAVLVAIEGVNGTVARTARAAAAITPVRAAAALAAVTCVVSLAGNSWTASGADSYAYVSQAALWRTGRLDLPVPLAADVPWPNAIATFATPGYRPAPDGRPALVPVTAPGLPLLMALAEVVGGHTAAFVITPIAAAVLVWFTFALGVRVAGHSAGLIGAWLVATSPAALFMLMWPMTDIPTAACTAVMLWGLVGETPGSAGAAGLAAAAGLLMRPNFVVIAAAAWSWTAAVAIARRGERRWRALAAFSVAALPGAMVVAAVNARWYGSAAASGYGTMETLLSPARVGVNFRHYVGWLAASSPTAFVGLAALALPFARVWSSPAARRRAWLLAITTAAAWIVYLAYGEFFDWWYLRFLLPSWPAVFVATGAVCAAFAARGRAARVGVTLAIAGVGIGGIAVAHARGVFNLGATERRYATVAYLVDTHTESDAVILTAQHAGTIRYYAGRETVRYDFLDAGWLDRAAEWLDRRGRHPYVLIEDWERPEFEARFAATNELGRLDWPPVLAWHSAHTPGDVFLYDLVRHERPTDQVGPEIENQRPRSARPR